jgi:hypothetical protein
VAAPPAVLIAVAACLTGCRGTAVAVSAASPAAATVSAAATASASAAGTSPAQAEGTAPDQPAATAQGSVTVSVSSPVTDSGTVAVPVSCVTASGYRATVSSAVVQGDQLSFTADIPRYPGPGSYYAVVAVTFRQATGTVTAVGHVSRVPAVITAAGGSFTLSAVGSGGRTFTGSLRWTCGS